MPGTATIYLCSDRDDLRAEREYLHATVFPELIARAAVRGVILTIIDPHRGAARTFVESLDEIDAISRSPLLFLALVGTRDNGRLIFSDIRDALPRLSRVFQCFRIEGELGRFSLELAFGIFGHAGAETNAQLFIRDARPAPTERDPQLDRLVAAIRTAGTKFAAYECRWDADAQRHDGFERLGQRVTEAIQELVDREANRVADPPQSFGELAMWARSEPVFDNIKWMLSERLLPSPKSIPVIGLPSAGKTLSLGAQAVPKPVDENVQFTVYRPKSVLPETWTALLAFAHLAEKPPDAPADAPDPVQDVQRQAKQILGDLASYRGSTQDSLHGVPKRGELTFLPDVPGLEFNPPRRTFTWQESVHREEFRFKADRALDGSTARGTLSIFHGAILLGDVALAIAVNSAPPAPAIRSFVDTGSSPNLEPVTAKRYRKIFASYSHKDLAIVEQFEAYAQSLGDEYLRDWKHLRAGERWHDKLMQMIREADVFQLFWSKHSMVSPFVRQEWEYALALAEKGPSFVRPTYWDDPMPTSADPPLPPPDLAALHFQRLAVPKDALIVHWSGHGAPPGDSDIFGGGGATIDTYWSAHIDWSADSGVQSVGPPARASSAPSRSRPESFDRPVKASVERHHKFRRPKRPLFYIVVVLYLIVWAVLGVIYALTGWIPFVK